MLIDNIFKLLKKVSKDEDQLSASFGFLLKEDSLILHNLLNKLGISHNNRELKTADIETLVPYVFKSKTSIIDLQLEIPGKCLIFFESKIVPTKIDRILNQIKPYNDILKSKEAEYGDGTRLVYVSRDSISQQQIDILARRLHRSRKEFLFFSWETLLFLIADYKRKNRRIIELFSDYIGDTMYNKKLVGDQKVKNISDVLVIFTTPYFWEMTLQKNIAVQKKSSPDARYIAFLRTHLRNKDGKRERSSITHIAEVNYSELRPEAEMLKGLDKDTKAKLTKHMEKRKVNFADLHKVYVLKPGSIKELAHKIDHYGPGPMVKFSTKMSYLLCAKSTRDIKKGRIT